MNRNIFYLMFICLLNVVLTENVYPLTPAQVFEKVKNSVVVVISFDNAGKLISLGSGVLVSTDRVATNYHVVKNGKYHLVCKDENKIKSLIYAYDEEKDICILEIKKIDYTISAQIGKSINLKVGDIVYAVGAPHGLELSLSNGVVSQLRGEPPPLIQTTAAISQGSSGGGLFDSEGRLVGLTTFYLKESQNLNFALPVEWISVFLNNPERDTYGNLFKDWAKHFSELEKKNDFQGMVEWGKKWTDNEPKSGNAWYNLGIAYDKFKDYKNAIYAYNKALKINPDDSDALINIGAVYYETKRYDNSIEAYKNALNINPNDANTWYNLGITYDKLKRYKKSIEAYNNCLSINQNYEKAWNNIAVAYYNTGDKKSAIDAISELKRLNPSKAIKLFNVLMGP